MGLQTSGSVLMNLDASGNLTTSGGITSGGAFKVQLDIVNSSPFTVTSAHHYLAVDSSAARTIDLPNVSDSDAGRLLTILDAGGQANSNNITINAAAGEDISGNSNYTINTAGGVVTIVCVLGS